MLLGEKAGIARLSALELGGLPLSPADDLDGSVQHPPTNAHDVGHAGSVRLIGLTRIADRIILGQTSREVRLGAPWRPDEILVDCGRFRRGAV
jgi:hypothetical protein